MNTDLLLECGDIKNCKNTVLLLECSDLMYCMNIEHVLVLLERVLNEHV